MISVAAPDTAVNWDNKIAKMRGSCQDLPGSPEGERYILIGEYFFRIQPAGYGW
jgi:hypothetical protein